MLVSVSTVRDTVPNVESFVRRNLAFGIDHLVVFLDVPDADVEAVLRGHEHVTLMVADSDWWRGQRPPGLNRRQNTHANIVKALLVDQDWAEWLFHIDADEIVQIDREQLESLPSDVSVVHLSPLETVTESQGRSPMPFKRLLTDDELSLLQLLGVLETAKNEEYFHGHVGGKSGLRPTLELYTGIHKPRTLDKVPVLGFQAEWLRLLHLESPSYDEFRRKWLNLVTSGTRPHTREARPGILAGLAALRSLGLDEATLDTYLRTIYDRTVRDDTTALRELNLLQDIDVDSGPYTPRKVPSDGVAELEDRLERVRAAKKQVFREGSPEAVRATLAGVDLVVR